MLSYPRARWIFLISGKPLAASDGMSEIWGLTYPSGRRAGRTSRRLARKIADVGKATDGQMGGRLGDEGPETVVLRDTCRNTEAARWRVNLTTGQRVL